MGPGEHAAQGERGPAAVWLTGRPCAGKSTLARLLADALAAGGVGAEVIDGDEVRRTVSRDLGFSPADRVEQARRVAGLAERALGRGRVAVVAVVAPTAEARAAARERLGERYVEVYVDAPVEVCEARDVKGMYARARGGELADFTGVGAPYEPPAAPALRLDTAAQTPEQALAPLLALLRRRGVAGEPARGRLRGLRPASAPRAGAGPNLRRMFGRRKKTQHYLPDVLNVPEPNWETIELVRSTGARSVAEIGIYEGATSAELAQVLSERDGELHLFDFQDRVDEVASRIREQSTCRIVTHGNTRKLLDSYVWTLGRLLEESPPTVFDYVFLDGSHLWAHDAPAFLLADRMLAVGGVMDFDDYSWSLGSSQTMNPDVYPLTADLNTAEQIARPQVAMVVDLLVKADPRYEELVPDKAYRKVA